MLLYFRGCTAREKLNSISKATERILRAANIKFETLDDEKCCGSVLLRTGFLDDAIEQMNSNLKDLEGKVILTSCAGCYKTLKEDYKKYLGIDLKVIHISQLLEQLIKEDKISLKGKDNLKVTYHDSCHLGRHAGEYEAPRNVIKAISDLVEMENIREKSRCCGSGGGVKSAYGDLSNSIADLRIKEAKGTDADLLVTACPFCKLNLNENSEDLDVLDLSEFVLRHLDLNDGNDSTLEEEVQ
ncbi:MAG: (Fe-S)-binding protein [Methanobrevibacter sp.]|nr:(Fe-S)-binding protein [Methanobrevibacter sp.]